MDFLNYWGLGKKPFENIGDPKFFYYSPCHKEAMVRLVYVIKQNKAGALLAGDYGTGKTTIANELLYEIEENDDYRSVYISNPLLTSKELLQEIAYKLDIKQGRSSRPNLRRMIENELRATIARDQQVIVIVDESHLITDRNVLEELRLMMNMQENNRFLVTIIMMGQLELRDIINQMPQFKQRFAMCYLLRHLDAYETKGYVRHRLKIAGTERDIFDDQAASLIYASSNGRPRQINNICDMSLLVGFMKKAERIDEQIIREVVKDLGEEI
ncbi:MAG: AAA family ATPase [Candidatus Omnitrophica bacterium]|nr:AAA family ATPase [Candidatus Omnitrophota bacterium]